MPKASSNVVLEVSHDDNEINIEVLWNGRRVGYVWCGIQDGGRLEIGDLKVEDRLLIRWSFPLNRLCLVGILPRTRSFRNQGIGTRLIERVVSEAKAAGIHEVWGSVTQDDIDRTPHLLEWYRRRGFTVLDKDQECLSNAAWKIVMKVDVGVPVVAAC